MQLSLNSIKRYVAGKISSSAGTSFRLNCAGGLLYVVPGRVLSGSSKVMSDEAIIRVPVRYSRYYFVVFTYFRVPGANNTIPSKEHS